MNDRQLRGGAAVSVVERTERSQQNARLRLARLAFALATMRSPTARAARASPKCTKSPNLIFFFGNMYPKIIPKYQNSVPKYQNSVQKYQNYVLNFFYQSYVPKSQILLFFFGEEVAYSIVNTYTYLPPGG